MVVMSEDDIANGNDRTNVFDTTLLPNGQVTVKKSVRELLGLETGDIIFLEVKKVVSKSGIDKFPTPAPIPP